MCESKNDSDKATETSKNHVSLEILSIAIILYRR